MKFYLMKIKEQFMIEMESRAFATVVPTVSMATADIIFTMDTIFTLQIQMRFSDNSSVQVQFLILWKK